MTNEIRIQMFDVDGKQYTTCSFFAMEFLLDHCSIIDVIETLIEENVYGHHEMFIETSYDDLDDETFKAYYISPDGIIKLAKEFGRDVQPKREIDLDGLLDAAIKTRIECEQTYNEVKKTNDEIRRLFGS